MEPLRSRYSLPRVKRLLAAPTAAAALAAVAWLAASKRSEDISLAFHFDGSGRLRVDLGRGGAFRVTGERIFRGERRIDEAPRVLTRSPVRVRRGEAVESFEPSPSGVEQRWTFERRPAGEGPLRVELSFDGARAHPSLSGIALATAQGAFVYGQATWVEASGRRHAVPVRASGGALWLEVPAGVVDGSEYPAVLDPVVAAERTFDTPVTGPASGGQFFARIGSDGTQYLVTWHDHRHGDMGGAYAARVSAQGQVLDPQGIALAARDGYDAHPSHAIFDGTNWLAVVQEGTLLKMVRLNASGAVIDPPGRVIRSYTVTDLPAVARVGSVYLAVWVHSSSGQVYGARFLADGTVLDPDGFAVETAGGWSRHVAVASNGTNFLVTWANSRNGNLDVFAARVTPGGVVLDPNGLPIAVAKAGDQAAPAVAAVPAGWLVAYHDAATGNGDIRAVWVDAGGGTGAAFDVSVTAERAQEPALTFDGANFVLLWVLRRASQDVVGVRISTSGAVLDPSPLVVADGPGDEDMPAVGAISGQLLAVWSDTRNGDRDLYMTRLTPALVPMDRPPTSLTHGANAQRQVAMAVGRGGWLALWHEQRSGAMDVMGEHVDAFGRSTAVRPATGSPYQAEPAVAFDGTNYLAVWQESRNIYGARISASGQLLDGAPFPICSCPGEQWSPAVAFDGTSYVVAWSDDRGLGTGDDVYAATVSTAGVVSPPGGFPVTTAPNDQTSIDVAATGGTALVVWTEQPPPSYGGDVYAARTRGNAVLDDPPIVIGKRPWHELEPAVATDGTQFFVVWRDHRYDSADIFATRISTDGKVLDPAGLPLSVEPSWTDRPAVAFDGRSYLVVWTDSRNASYDIYGLLVDKDGRALWPRALPLADSPEREDYARLIAERPGRFLLAYEKFDSALSAIRVRARYVTEYVRGEACSSDEQCATGFCVDGVCCESACGGGAADCQACSVAAGASVDGTCTVLGAGAVCRRSDGACDQAETCDGVSLSCPADVRLPDGASCTGGTCRAGACVQSGAPRFASGAGASIECGEAWGYSPAGAPEVLGQGPFTFSATGAPEGMTVDAATGAVSWTPTQEQEGEYLVRLHVESPAGFDEQVLALRVTCAKKHAKVGCAAGPNAVPAVLLALLAARFFRRR